MGESYRAGDLVEIIPECPEIGRQWGPKHILPVGYIATVFSHSSPEDSIISIVCPFENYISKYLHMYKKYTKLHESVQKVNKCICPLNTIMSTGCQCGGT